MLVKDIMAAELHCLSPTSTVAEAVRLMLANRTSGLPVVDEAGALVGIVTEGDFLRRAELGTQRPHARCLQWLLNPGQLAHDYARAHSRWVRDVMTSEVATISHDAQIDEAVALMEARHIRHLPVVADGRLIGMITRTDLLRALAGIVSEASDDLSVDERIRRLVLARLQREAWAPLGTVEAEVKDGIVQLRGCLTDERQRAAVRVTAEHVPGVRMVRDHMVCVEPVSGVVVCSPEDTRKDGEPRY